MNRNIIKELEEAKLITPPKWLSSSLVYATITGSKAYGTSTKESDIDIYGVAVPPKEVLFPHLLGYIPGFGIHPPSFEQFQVQDVTLNGESFDITIFSIVKYINSAWENNPNIVDTLFTGDDLVIYRTEISDIIRENGSNFITKDCKNRFAGYSQSQWKKTKIKEPAEDSKRYASKLLFGYDTKFAMHAIRMLLECEQLLTTKRMELDTNSELLLKIRQGDFSFPDLEDLFNSNKDKLDQLAIDSTLPNSCKDTEDDIKSILAKCLNIFYGD